MKLYLITRFSLSGLQSMLISNSISSSSPLSKVQVSVHGGTSLAGLQGLKQAHKAKIANEQN